MESLVGPQKPAALSCLIEMSGVYFYKAYMLLSRAIQSKGTRSFSIFKFDISPFFFFTFSSLSRFSVISSPQSEVVGALPGVRDCTPVVQLQILRHQTTIQTTGEAAWGWRLQFFGFDGLTVPTVVGSVSEPRGQVQDPSGSMFITTLQSDANFASYAFVY